MKKYWELLTAQRLDEIVRMVNGNYYFETRLDPQLNMEHLKDSAICSDTSFYTLAVQAGYLSHNHIGHDTYEVFIPNEEAKRTWARLILDYRYDSPDSKLREILGLRKKLCK